MTFRLVCTTLETKLQAEELASQIVQERLAACIQIVGPITSVYRWQGKVERATEFRCEMKTHSRLMPRLVRLIEDSHPYDVPEIVSLALSSEAAPYTNWLEEQLDDRDASG